MLLVDAQETKIARDFSIVTLETDPVYSEKENNAPKGNGKLSEELFSWRKPQQRGLNGNGSPGPLASAASASSHSAMSEDLASVSSDLSEVSSFLSSEGGLPRSLSTRHPASQRTRLSGVGPQAGRDEERDSLRNESIAVGIGLLLLFFFTYVVQYCARHGYIKIPDHEDLVGATTHEEL